MPSIIWSQDNDQQLQCQCGICIPPPLRQQTAQEVFRIGSRYSGIPLPSLYIICSWCCGHIRLLSRQVIYVIC